MVERKWLVTASILVLILANLTACQTNSKSSAQLQTPELHAQAFIGAVAPVESVEDIFALSEADKTAVKAEMRAATSAQAKTQALLHYIFKSDELPLEYVNSATLVASVTLQRRQANCLSLTILAYALAQEVGFTAEFQEVDIPEFWITDAQQSRLNGHVNLVIVPPTLSFENGSVNLSNSRLTVDFDTENRDKAWPVRPVSKEDIVAMFYNNKAADSLAAGNYQQTFAYLRAAIEIAPDSAQSWSNLSVLYRQVGLYQQAEESYLFSLQLDPQSMNTMANLAMLYRIMAQPEQAMALENVVERKRKQNPFYFLMLGEEALNEKQTKSAIGHFQQALRLNSALTPAMLGLAKSYILEGDIDKATRYLQDARQMSRSRDERDRYESKLKVLQQVAILH